MSKERTSVTVDEDVKSYLQRESVNASGLVNKLIKQHMGGGRRDEQVLKMRLQQLEDEVESLDRRLENKKEQLSRVRSEYETCRDKRQETLEKAAEILTGDTQPGDLNPDDKKVEYWANEAGLTPEQLIEELR